MDIPYKNDQQIAEEYARAYKQYFDVQRGQAERQKQSKDSEYNDSQRQGYVNYMQAKKDIPTYLSNLGVSGGGAETTALKSDTNYQNGYQSIERQRNTDKTAIDNMLTDTMNKYKMVSDDNMRNEQRQTSQLRNAYIAEQNRLAEDRFAKTVSGYNTVASIDAEIENIKRRGVPGEWSMYVPYLKARRAELEQQTANATSYTSGGGGYTSYSAPKTQVEEPQPESDTGSILERINSLALQTAYNRR